MGTSQRDYDVRLSKIYSRLNLGDTSDFGTLEQILDVLSTGTFTDFYCRSNSPNDNNIIVNGGTLITTSGTKLTITDATVSLSGLATASNYNNVAVSIKPSTGVVSLVAGIENANPLLIVDPVFKTGDVPLSFVQIQGAVPVISQSNITDMRQLTTSGYLSGSNDLNNLVTLTNGTTTHTVTFGTPFAAGTTYHVVCTLDNITDANPQFQPLTVTSRLTTGFTVKWNAPLDSANYKLSYKVIIL